MLDLPLARCECSHADSSSRAPQKRRQSGQVAAPNPRATRVRVEIAGRAHRGKFTPKLGISLQGIKVKKRMGILEIFFEKGDVGWRGKLKVESLKWERVEPGWVLGGADGTSSTPKGPDSRADAAGQRTEHPIQNLIAPPYPGRWWQPMSALYVEEHVRRLLPSLFAILEIEDQVVFQDVIGGRES